MASMTRRALWCGWCLACPMLTLPKSPSTWRAGPLVEVPTCMRGPTASPNAPRGLRRSFRRDLGVDGAELGRRLVRACDQRMTGLLLAARRLRRVAVGADAAIEALGRGESAGAASNVPANRASRSSRFSAQIRRRRNNAGAPASRGREALQCERSVKDSQRSL